MDPTLEIAKLTGIKRRALDPSQEEELRSRMIHDLELYRRSVKSTMEWISAGVAVSMPKAKRAKTATSEKKTTRRKEDDRIVIESRKTTSDEELRQMYGEDALIAHISTDNTAHFRALHPTFPHGKIPIPGADATAEHRHAASVEGLYEGMKVFSNATISYASMENTDMRNIKRYQSASKGQFQGYKEALNSNVLLNELQARQKLYLPAYKFVLDGAAHSYLEPLMDALAQGKKVVLVDSKKQQHKISDEQHPISYALLIALYLKNEYPICDEWIPTV